jgi:hypothetical protein
LAVSLTVRRSVKVGHSHPPTQSRVIDNLLWVNKSHRGPSFKELPSPNVGLLDDFRYYLTVIHSSTKKAVPLSSFWIPQRESVVLLGKASGFELRIEFHCFVFMLQFYE